MESSKNKEGETMVNEEPHEETRVHVETHVHEETRVDVENVNMQGDGVEP